MTATKKQPVRVFVDGEEAAMPRQLEFMPLSALIPADRNPKDHDEALIDASINRFGFMETPVVDERTGKLVAGHGRTDDLRAKKDAGKPPPEGVLEQDGEWLVPVLRGWSSKDDEEALAAGIALNHVGEVGGWDDRELTEILKEIAERSDDVLLGTGFDEMGLANLLMITRPAHEVRDFDAASQWVGLPEFDPVGGTQRLPTLLIRFDSEEQRAAFCEQVEMTVTRHAESGPWTALYPKQELRDSASMIFNG